MSNFDTDEKSARDVFSGKQYTKMITKLRTTRRKKNFQKKLKNKFFTAISKVRQNLVNNLILERQLDLPVHMFASRVCIGLFEPELTIISS